MTSDAQEELILRHLDGGTSPDEVARLTGLLAEDADFRLRFFTYANLITELQENLALVVSPAPDLPHGSPPAMLASPIPEARASRETGREPQLEHRLPADLFQCGHRRRRRVARLAGHLRRLGAVVSLSSFNVYLRDAIIGPLVGVCIGFAVGAADGLLGARSLRRMFRGGQYGAVLGALGGVLGLTIGEFFFNQFHGGVLPRAIGWGLFGMLVGISEGVSQGMPVKVRYGILGGLLGGLIGGSTYECLTAMFRGGGALALGQCHRPGHPGRLHWLPGQPGRSTAAEVLGVLRDGAAGGAVAHARFEPAAHPRQRSRLHHRPAQ